MNRFTRIVALAVVAVSFSGLSIACNTMEGAGKDLEKGGEAIQDAAD